MGKPPPGSAGKSLTDGGAFDFCFVLLFAVVFDALAGVCVLNRTALAGGADDVIIGRAVSIPPKAGKFSFVRARPLVPNCLVFRATMGLIETGAFPSDGNSWSLRASITGRKDADGVGLYSDRVAGTLSFVASSCRFDVARFLGAKLNWRSMVRACFDVCPCTLALCAFKSMSLRKAAVKIFSLHSASSHR